MWQCLRRDPREATGRQVRQAFREERTPLEWGDNVGEALVAENRLQRWLFQSQRAHHLVCQEEQVRPRASREPVALLLREARLSQG